MALPEDKSMRRPTNRLSRKALPQGHEFTEGGRRMRVVGHTIREVTERPADLTLCHKPGRPSALDEHVRRANARLATESNSPLLARFVRLFLAW